MKIRLVVIELFHADRQTDMKKLILPFRNFAPKKSIIVNRLKFTIIINEKNYMPPSPHTHGCLKLCPTDKKYLEAPELLFTD